MRAIAIIVLCVAFASCTPGVRYTADWTPPHSSASGPSGRSGNEASSGSPVESDLDSDRNQGDVEVLRGKASYYADKFHGRRTANGELFDMNELTAAHKTLPFGTVVEVTNLVNNRSVVVRINDRGPFVAGRIIDLSKKAAEVIDMINAGVVEVEVRILQRGRTR